MSSGPVLHLCQVLRRQEIFFQIKQRGISPIVRKAELSYLYMTRCLVLFYTSTKILFVLRFYSPFNPMGSCPAWSVYLTTCLLGRLTKRLTSILHILSPKTDNCPFWISGRERMTVENILWSISTKECCWPQRGSNPWPLGLQLDAHPTAPLRLVLSKYSKRYSSYRADKKFYAAANGIRPKNNLSTPLL